MYLTKEEERMLSGEEGEATARALRLVVRVGEALGAERLVRITHAHVSGISYTNIGDAGLEFIEDLARRGARFRVYTTFNPVGLCLGDAEYCSEVMEADKRVVEKQLRIIEALRLMGAVDSTTCTPYELRRPLPGEHLAWGESSAVAVANTVYGARTNREGGPIALAAAIVGRTYYWGLHLDNERRPTILVRLRLPGLDELRAGLLGYIVGHGYGEEKPYITPWPGGVREAIAYSAAAATAGSISFSVIDGLSPEKTGKPGEGAERITVDEQMLREAREELSTAPVEDADLFFTGCPHATHMVLEKIVRLAEKYGPPTRRLWIAVPGYMHRRLRQLQEKLEKLNIRLMPGTCLVVSRIHRDIVVATDSVKTALYLPRRHGVRVALATLEEFIRRHSKHKT